MQMMRSNAIAATSRQGMSSLSSSAFELPVPPCLSGSVCCGTLCGVLVWWLVFSSFLLGPELLVEQPMLAVAALAVGVFLGMACVGTSHSALMPLDRLPQVRMKRE
jgi:hypothetical protein